MRYPRLDRAIGLAAQMHAGQEREGDSPLPYVTHPMEVLLALRFEGGETDGDLLCAAALHDVIEESGADLSEIESVVGHRAAGLVRELTRREPSRDETKGMSKDEIWTLRANMLLDEIRKMSPEAQRVKLADRLANVREARRTKAGPKWDRYAWQTEEILKIVPRERSVGLWDAIRKELDSEGKKS
jgi:(p)ppGpp synthase/HD superfamily hydrolase